MLLFFDSVGRLEDHGALLLDLIEYIERVFDVLFGELAAKRRHGRLKARKPILKGRDVGLEVDDKAGGREVHWALSLNWLDDGPPQRAALAFQREQARMDLLGWGVIALRLRTGRFGAEIGHSDPTCW